MPSTTTLKFLTGLRCGGWQKHSNRARAVGSLIIRLTIAEVIVNSMFVLCRGAYELSVFSIIPYQACGVGCMRVFLLCLLNNDNIVEATISN